jgi:hypothetical protein
VRLEPSGDAVEVFLRETEPLSEFLRGEPAVEVRLGRVVELFNELLERLLLLRRTLQLKQHVLHPKVVCNRSSIVYGVHFGTRIALESDQPGFVNLFRDQGARMQPCINSSS